MPLHLQLLVKWEVVSPNSRYREFYHEIGNIEKFPGGGGGCNVFLTFYAISNISRKKNLGIQNNYFSFNVFFVFFFVCWKYCKVPLHLQLLVKWEVVSPNSRYREFYHEIGNNEKFPFTYWLNGRWFLQIVDIMCNELGGYIFTQFPIMITGLLSMKISLPAAAYTFNTVPIYDPGGPNPHGRV